MSLTEIADRYRSDKGNHFSNTDFPGHLYTEYYDDIFCHMKDLPISLLEIGVAKGASLLMWNEYFKNSKRIVGLDNDLGQVNKLSPPGVEGGDWQKNIEDYGEIELYGGDQGNINDLLCLVEEDEFCYDIIIDDGSHKNYHQQFTFGCLFPFVKPGGWYIIEDIHAEGSSVNQSDQSTLSMIFRWMATGKITSPNIELGVCGVVEKNIDFMTIYYRHNTNFAVGNGDAFCLIRKCD